MKLPHNRQDQVGQKAIDPEQNNRKAEQEHFLSSLFKTPEELIRNLSHLSLIFNSINDAILIVDLNGKVKFGNKAYQDYFQKFQDELENRSLEEFKGEFELADLEGNTVSLAQRPMARIVRGEVVDREKIKILKKNGHTIYLKFSGAPIKDEQGEHVASVLLVTDITQQEETNHKLSENEKSYRSLFETNPEPMWIYDLETFHFLEVNQAAVHHYGYSREEFLNMTLKDIRPAEEVSKLLEDIKNTKTTLNHAGVWRHTKKNGEIIEVEITSHSTDFQGRKARHVLVKDMTEKTKALDALKSSEKRFRNLFENMTQGVVYQNTEGFITAANHAAQEILGLSLQQMQGRTSMDPRWRAIREDGTAFPGEEHPAIVSLKTGRQIKDVVMGVYHPVKQENRWINIHSTAVFETGEDRPSGVFSVFDDISRQKMAEEAQKESEARFQSVFNNMFSFATLLSTDGKIIEINETARQQFNLEPSQLLGKYIYDLHWWSNGKTDFSNLIKENVGKAALGEFVREELKLTDPNGAVYIMDITIKPIRDAAGKVVLLIQEARDITEMKLQEESARILNRMFQKSTAGVAISDAQHPDMPFMDVNEAYARITGYTKEEIIGKNGRFLQGEQRNQPALEIIRRAIKEEKECKVELLNYRKSGEPFWNDLYLAPVHDQKGKLTHYVSIQQDVTKWKNEQLELEAYRNKLEELVQQRTHELQISEEKLLFTQQLTKMGSWEYHPEEDRAKWSAETYRIFQRDPEKGAKNLKEMLESIVPEDRTEGIPMIREVLKNGQSFTHIFRHFTDKGNIRYLKHNGQAVFTNGKIAYFLGSILDVTHEKRTEQKLNEAVKAAEMANKAKSIFLANMSHEIRTPLNSIIGFSEILSKTIVNEKRRSQIESIRNSGKSLLKIINDILDLSKVEAGKVILEREPTDVLRLVREVGVMFEPKTAEKQLSLYIDAETALSSPLMLDETRLRQILFNLLGNAIKFTNQGSISVFIRHQEKENQLVDLQIRIKDTGLGIPEDQLAAIFEPFVQQQGQAQKVYGGTGLGLAISQRLVEAMGGEIRVKSILNEGSEFTVYLKNISKMELQAEEKHPELALYGDIQLNGKTILIVDDIADNRKLLWDALENTGARLVEAANGAEAVQVARQENPDLILMDVRMPVMDGKEAAKMLKQAPETVNIPCIAVSASIKLGKLDKDALENFEDYLIKPIDLNHLFHVLLRYLENQKGMLPFLPSDTSNTPTEKEWPDELKRIVKNELIPLYQQVRKKQLVDEMEAFGKKILATGRQFDDELLINIGSELVEYADLFDVEKLNQTLNKFQLILNGKLN